jgi:hypothetical protein
MMGMETIQAIVVITVPGITIPIRKMVMAMG